MARFSLIPREHKFYDDFIALVEQLKEAARLLDDMLAVEPPLHLKAHEIKEVEHKCDFLTHEVIQRLNKTFVTPLDREDIHRIAVRLDDVVDAIDNVASLIPLYRIQTVRYGARELCGVIRLQADAMQRAFVALEKQKGVLEHCVEVNRLENEADRIYKDALGRLFDTEKDPITLIKWKELLGVLEQATDRAEDVVNMLENVVVKGG